MEQKDKYKSAVTMAQAVKLLGLKVYGLNSDSEPVRCDGSSVNILCPNCSDSHTSRRLTLNIDFEKNCFGCSRCGDFSGGVYKLVSYYTGIPYEEVEKKLLAGEIGDVREIAGGQSGHNNQVGHSTDVGRPIAHLKQRHEVYSAFLDYLTLNEAHAADLLRRGLSEADIKRIGFKSFPKYMDPTVIPKKLINSGLDLRGVPGFGINDSGNWIVTSSIDGGYLVPSKNGQGLIQGFQIRHDHPNDRVPKFGYFTSGNITGGTKAGTWCSWAGEDLSKRATKEPFDVILIEGPLKAYIVNAIVGCNVIAVPGVTSLKKVVPALKSMMDIGLRTVYIAYDMDQEENEDVAKALNKLRGILTDMGIHHKTMFWNNKYKGLDDWIVSPEFSM